MPGTPTTRPEFYRRTPDPPRIELQERDWTILRALARWRFLRKQQIDLIVGGSAQTATRRLKLLYDHKIVTRPSRQRALLAHEPTPDGIYGLTRTGARLIAIRDGFDLERLDHVSKNERVGAEFILHTVGIADAMLRFHLDAASHGVSEVLEQHELLPLLPDRTRALAQPFLWPVAAVPFNGATFDINLVPDRLFSLIVPGGRINLVYEHNRSLTIRPNAPNFRRNTAAWKICGYFEGFRRNLHASRWGFERMRVLTTETTRERALKHAALTRDLTHDRFPGLFLVSDIDTLRSNGPYARDTWINQRGEPAALLA